MTLVTLTTDFGLSDGYVAAIKGVLLSATSDITLVDVSHEVAPQDVMGGRWVLESTYAYFPKGTIHLAVVDPGVGTDRKALVVEWQGQIFFAPDNGLLGFAKRETGAKYWEIRRELFPPGSTTFDGRDLFALAVGKWLKGQDLAVWTSSLAAIKDLTIPRPTHVAGGLEAEIIYVDRFGNLITNVARQDVLGAMGQAQVVIAAREIEKVSRSYCDVARGVLLALWNSSGRLEIAVRDGSAAETLKCKRGEKLKLRNAGQSL